MAVSSYRAFSSTRQAAMLCAVIIRLISLMFVALLPAVIAQDMGLVEGTVTNSLTRRVH